MKNTKDLRCSYCVEQNYSYCSVCRDKVESETRCEICGGKQTHHALGCVKNIAINKAYQDAIEHCIEVIEMCKTKQDAINLLKGIGEVRLSMTEKMKESVKKLITD